MTVADVMNSISLEDASLTDAEVRGLPYGVSITLLVSVKQVLTARLFGAAAAGETATDSALVTIRRHREPSLHLMSWVDAERSEWLLA